MSDERARRWWPRLTLSRMVAVVWGAWLAGLVWMAVVWGWQVLHPHFLPLVVLLAIQVVGGLTVLVAALLRMAIGPRRVEALAWLFLGTTPLWLWAAHFSYGFWVAEGRVWSTNLMNGSTAAAGAALADAIARLQYPRRLEGRRTVMIYAESPAAAREVEAMDRHVERLEELLGRPCRAKVHWIRGGILGMSGRYFQGLSLGLDDNTQPVGEDGLTDVDRHEVAHFVLHHHCRASSEPPSLLVEGWAEAQSGYEPGYLVRRAWGARTAGTTMTLRELTSPDWYHRHDYEVYEHGGVLVDYLLRAFGAAKFFELYTTCREETFEADCHRILGVGPDELDRRYWGDVEAQFAATGEPLERNPFAEVKLGEQVDPATWARFLAEYPAARKRLEEPYRQVQLEMESVTTSENAEGGQTTRRLQTTVAVCGDWHRLLTVNEEGASVFVAHPRESFCLVRRPGQSEWQRRPAPEHYPQRYHYAQCRQQVRRALPLANDRIRLRIPEPPGIVTRFEQFEAAGEPQARIVLESAGDHGEGAWSRRDEFTFLPEKHWAAAGVATTITRDDGAEVALGLEVQYGPDRDGVPVVEQVRSTYQGLEGRLDESVDRLLRYDFSPTPEEGFTPAAFDVAPTPPESWWVRLRLPLHAIVTWSGAAVWLALGPALLCGVRLRKKLFGRRSPAAAD